MLTMKTTSFLLIHLVVEATAFVPTCQRGTGSTRLAYTNNRDSIAKEIVDLQDHNFQKTETNDENPWRQILDSGTTHENVEKLTRALRRAIHAEHNEVEFLQRKLFSLYMVATELTTRELQLANQLAEMEKERDDLWKLLRRVVVVSARNVKNRIGDLGNGILHLLRLKSKATKSLQVLHVVKLHC